MLLQAADRLVSPDTVYVAQQWGSVSDLVVAACTIALTISAIVQGLLLRHQIRLQSAQTSSGISQTATMQRQEALMRATRDEIRESTQAQAVVTAEQLGIMRAQQKELSEQVRIDRSRFISTYPPSLAMSPPIASEVAPSATNEDEEIDTKVQLRFTISNSGLTRARKIRVFCSSYWILDGQAPKGLSQGRVDAPEKLAPTQHAEVVHTSDQIGFFMALIDRTRNASSNVIVEAVAWYNDETGRPHTSTALFVFNTKTGAFQHAVSGKLQFPRLGQ